MFRWNFPYFKRYKRKTSGRVKNIHKAIAMLNKRFPELNLAFTDTSNLNAFYDQSVTSPDEPYNYEEFFMGSVNNNVNNSS